MKPLVSVIIPVYNAEATLAECLAAVRQQSTDFSFETIVVDDGSSDRSAKIARQAGVRCIEQKNGGAAAARNTGARAAAGDWVAFTDSDCIPSRRWLRHLVQHAERLGPRGVGVAGRIVGHHSTTPAARFVDVSGGLDSERHLAHPVFPFAISGNVMYRREAFLAVGGFDERFVTYESCDLHHRLGQQFDGSFAFEARALVLHRHRDSWQSYWRQQVGYGRGYAQLFLRYRSELPWSALREVAAWIGLAAGAPRALVSYGDRGLVRRGNFLKSLAQRWGFLNTYFDRTECNRWSTAHQTSPRSDFSGGTTERLTWVHPAKAA